VQLIHPKLIFPNSALSEQRGEIMRCRVNYAANLFMRRDPKSGAFDGAETCRKSSPCHIAMDTQLYCPE
jgi:hypothetical protein